MRTIEESFYNEKLSTENNFPLRGSEKKKQLSARKRIEDYIAEKELKENIKDFDYRF